MLDPIETYSQPLPTNPGTSGSHESTGITILDKIVILREMMHQRSESLKVAHFFFGTWKFTGVMSYCDDDVDDEKLYCFCWLIIELAVAMWEFTVIMWKVRIGRYGFGYK